MTYVVGEVEVDVVRPERPARLQRWHDDPLPKARNLVEPAADVLDEVGVERRRPLEDQDRADVHVAGGALVGQERGVDGGQPIQMVTGGRHAARLTAIATLLCMAPTVTSAPKRVLLAAPRGYCAGVDRAVQTVERALDLYGAPVYVRKEIVHNKHVVAELGKRGAVFVDELDESIPEGAVTVFSAHGVSPAVHADAERRGLQTIDATCPLVTKVHREVLKFARDGYTIVLIGHAGHEEVEGTMGEAPEHTVLVETEDDVDRLDVADPEKVAYVSQTTLSV